MAKENNKTLAPLAKSHKYSHYSNVHNRFDFVPVSGWTPLQLVLVGAGEVIC